MNLHKLLRIAPISEVARLRLYRLLLDRAFDAERRKIIKAGGTPSDIWESGSWQFEYQDLDEQEARLHSRQLMNRARKLRIPVPAVMVEGGLSEDYQRSGFDNHTYFLSLTGEQRLRAAIREEEKYRDERWIRKLPIVSIVSGLVGSVTGLVALLTK